MTLPVQDFVNNIEPVGGGEGPSLDAGFFNALVDGLTDVQTGLAGKANTVDVTPVVALTQAAYDALVTPAPGTLYVIIP